MILKWVVAATIGVIVTTMLLIPVCNLQDDENTLDVIVIDGQSNAQYWGWTTNNICSPSQVNSSGLEAPTHNLYYYGDSTPIDYGITYPTPTYDITFESYDIHPMYQNDSWVVGGYEPVLARSISEKSGHDVLIINVGVGAAQIKWLTSTGPGGIWADKVISHALSKIPSGYHVDMLGLVWAQGESDDDTPVDTYIERFNKLYDDFSSTFGINKVYIVKTRDAVGGNSIIAQNELAADNENITIATDITDEFTTANGYLNTDNLHYTQSGRSLIAEKLGEVIEYNEHEKFQGQDLIALIPLLVIIGLIIGITGIIIMRRE